MSNEIKLGWYRGDDGYCRDFELLAIRGDDRACVWANGGLFTVSLDVIQRREYLGTELPPKGKWVQVDPATFTIDMFPVKGKGSNEGIVWNNDELIGYYLNPDHRPFVCNSRNYKRFQIWEESR